jgi:hypothetical protein
VWEWNEAIIFGSRGVRGGAFFGDSNDLAASFRGFTFPSLEAADFGFRVATLPEPGSGLLLIMGMLGLAAAHRQRGA